MHDNPPLISIGMPVRNTRETLPLAIRSIRWQTYPHWELLVIDDGSNDQTQEIARRYSEADRRIRVLSDGRHLGLSYRLNQAIALSRGHLFARMDGDDVAYPDRLERQVEYLRSHPEVDLVGAAAVVFDDDGVALGKRVGPESHGEICAHPYAGFPVMHPIFAGRIEFFRKYGYTIESILGEDQDLFSRTFPNGLNLTRGGMGTEDQDLLLRSHRDSRFANIQDVLLGYREPELKVGKIFKARCSLVKMLYYSLWKKSEYIKFILFSILHIAKFLIECAAIWSRLNYHLLRHRAKRATPDERDRWKILWEELQGETVR